MQRLMSRVGGARPASLATCLLLLGATPVFAQPAGDQMCGDGTTFAVDLPVVDDSPGGGLVFPFATLEPDAISLPRGCDIYLLVVSDAGRNRQLDELLFYPLARFAAERNGYVHYAWWNNLLKPYMEQSVHRIREEFGGDLSDASNHPGKKFTKDAAIADLSLPAGSSPTGEHEVYQSECQFTNPSTGRVVGSILDVFGAAGCAALEAAADLFYSPVLRRPFPDSMKQFEADAAQFVRRVRQENPDAIIVVAGHGLGAHAGALVSTNVDAAIDLLALIDPYASRSEPDGSEVDDTGLKGSRERALQPILGYARRDCVRNAVFLCQNSGTFFRPIYTCFTRNEVLTERPLVGSFAPVHCPGPVVLYSDRQVSARRVYHRWQGETGPPQDFNTFHKSYINAFPNPLNPTEDQMPWPAALSGTPPAGGLCGDATVEDPRFPGSKCSPFDGHDELVGFRALRSEAVTIPGFTLQVDLRIPLGVKAQAWPLAPDIDFLLAGSLQRRQELIEMATTDPDNEWPHRPAAPELCLVCDDLIAITQELLDERDGGGDPEVDLTTPATIAAASPAANAEGWHAADVLINLSASDAGSGVKEIQRSLSGAQSGGPVITSGDAVQETIVAEGTTLLSYFARDNAGNEEPSRVLEVRIDRTPPEIAAVVDIAPNANGWHRTGVQVTFDASDALSGLRSSSAPVTVSDEGAEQEVIGTAEDKADNLASASAILNIDTSPPLIAFTSRTPAANAAGWNNSDVTVTWACADAISGPVSPAVAAMVTAEGAAQAVIGTCQDLADNTASDTQSNISIDETNPSIAISAPADGAAYPLNAAVTSDYACADALSGVGSCNGPVASGGRVDTSVVGAGSFTVNSADIAGNDASSTHRYSVQYAFSGFSSPIAPMPMANVIKAGRTVPVKYHLQDAHGAFISDLGSFASLASSAVACDAAAPGVEVETTDGAGSTTIRYDIDASQFVYNWKTEHAWAGSCRMLQLTLNDGTTHLALFEFR